MWHWIVASVFLSAFLLFYLWKLKFDRSGASQPEGARPVEPACSIASAPSFPEGSTPGDEPFAAGSVR